jgi:hypothetical protein
MSQQEVCPLFTRHLTWSSVCSYVYHIVGYSIVCLLVMYNPQRVEQRDTVLCRACHGQCSGPCKQAGQSTVKDTKAYKSIRRCRSDRKLAKSQANTMSFHTFLIHCLIYLFRPPMVHRLLELHAVITIGTAIEHSPATLSVSGVSHPSTLA